MFEGEELLFNGEAAAVSGEFAAGTDDAVAGNDDGNGVRTVGKADGAGGVGVAEAAGNLSVGDGGAVRDAEEGVPDGALEGSARGGEVEVKVAKFAGEIGMKLGGDVGQGGAILLPGRVRFGAAGAGEEVDAEEASGVADEAEGAQGGVDLGVGGHENGFITAEEPGEDGCWTESDAVLVRSCRLGARIGGVTLSLW